MTEAAIQPPLSLLLELTHRCPLRCAYCSNPLQLVAASEELGFEYWADVIDQAVNLGVLQASFSGGEPMSHPAHLALIRHAAQRGLYSNLLTSGVLLDAPRIAELKEAGLNHIQLSFQDLDEDAAARVSGFHGGVAIKRKALELIREAGIAFTLNFVITRINATRLEAMLQFALESGVARVEIANTQYYGWGLKNRAALIPSQAQLDTMNATIRDWRQRYKGQLVIDYVVPDYYARRPKSCMSGWGQRFINVMPDGAILPCHAAQTLKHLNFPNIRTTTLAQAWFEHPAFAAYRGTHWMPDPCQSCEDKEKDWGGCRCQALALAGDASQPDPVCERSALHEQIVHLARRDAGTDHAPIHLRRMWVGACSIQSQ